MLDQYHSMARCQPLERRNRPRVSLRLMPEVGSSKMISLGEIAINIPYFELPLLAIARLPGPRSARSHERNSTLPPADLQLAGA